MIILGRNECMKDAIVLNDKTIPVTGSPELYRGEPGTAAAEGNDGRAYYPGTDKKSFTKAKIELKSMFLRRAKRRN